MMTLIRLYWTQYTTARLLGHSVLSAIRHARQCRFTLRGARIVRKRLDRIGRRA
jgi:hypothetical protein